MRIVYAGDLDPSGWGIYENIVNKLDIMNKTGLDIAVDRFALQEDQVSGLHHIPVKMTDSRLKAFMEKFPHLPGAYELDAVPPLQLMEMARTAVEKYFDTDLEKERAKEVRVWRDEYRLLVSDVFARLGLDPKSKELISPKSG